MSWRKNPNPTIKPPFGSYINYGHPLAEGLVGCFVFNEAEGKALNNLCDNTNISTSGSSVIFNEDFIKIDSVDLSPPILGITEALAKVTYQDHIIVAQYASIGDSNDGDIIGNNIYASGGVLLQHDANGYIKGHITEDSTTIRSVTGTNIIRTSTFNQVAQIVTGSELSVWVNGEKDTSVAITGRTQQNNDFVVAGRSVAQGNNSDCRLKYLYIYTKNEGLNPDIVSWLYGEPYAFIVWPSRLVLFDFGTTNVISLLADIQAISSTTAVPRKVARSLLADIPASCVLTDIASSVFRSLLVDVIMLSNTSAIVGSLLRSILAQIAAISISADVAARTSRVLTVDIAAVSDSTVPRANIARQVIADIQMVSNTSDITAALSGVISLVASIPGVSSTSDTGVVISRNLLAVINAESESVDALANIARSLLAGIAVASDTSDITASLQNIISLVANITGVSLTSDTTADMARSLSALVASQSDADDIMASVARSLLADIAGTSVTLDDLILVLSGLGLIIDPEIESLTPIHMLESVTKKRIIEST